jgi:hypothetical protein
VSTDSVLPHDLAALVDAEMASGERVVWISRPNPGRFARNGLGIALFGIPWTAFALFWINGASGFKWPELSNGFGVFPLFGIPFVLIGLGMISSPIWMLRRAMRIAYVVTDKRLIVVERPYWRGVKVQSFEPDRIADLRRTQYPDGSGNLIFGRDYSNVSARNRNPIEEGFFGIPDVKAAEDCVRELMQQSKIEHH